MSAGTNHPVKDKGLKMQITNDVKNVLGCSRVEGNKLFLTDQLERNLYVRANKVLEAAGAKWNRKEKAHIFNADAAERIDQMILTGAIEIPRDIYNFFPTPLPLINKMVESAAPAAGERVLDPEFGDGRILFAVLKAAPDALIYGVELNDERFNQVQANSVLSQKANLTHGDFLEFNPEDKFDVILMNPPFLFRSDIKHVMHALELLTPNGRLQAVMSSGVVFREDNLTKLLRERVKLLGGTTTPLPAETFKDAGTKVSTVRLEIDLRG